MRLPWHPRCRRLTFPDLLIQEELAASFRRPPVTKPSREERQAFGPPRSSRDTTGTFAFTLTAKAAGNTGNVSGASCILHMPMVQHGQCQRAARRGKRRENGS